MKVQIPKKLIPVFTPAHGAVRIRGAYGGRGSAKSYTFAKMVLIYGAQRKLRVLCTREYLNSIKESFLAELKRVLEDNPWLGARYDVGIDYLRGLNGTEFIFAGLRNNISSIKSLAAIDICIVEEAEEVPEYCWLILVPTIRKEGSELWIVWNPKKRGSYVDRLREQAKTDKRILIVEVNHADNPWFPKVLDDDRRSNKENWDPELYHHVWEGGYFENSDSQIFRGRFEIQEFTPERDWPMYSGLDWGFAQDPTAAVECYVYDDCLFIYREVYEYGLELDQVPDVVNSTLLNTWRFKTKIRCDNARPDSISYVKRHGLPNAVACKKGKGSIEHGINHLKTYRRIYIHPQCKNTLEEFINYSYERDRTTGDVTNKIIDKYNHSIDAIRYALEPVSKLHSRGFF